MKKENKQLKGLMNMINDSPYTLNQIAKEVDVTLDAISKYKNGKRIPSVIVAIKLADFFEVDVRDLL